MKDTPRVPLPHRPIHLAGFVAALLAGSLLAARAQTTIPASLKATPGSYNVSLPGFVVRSHQIAVPRGPGDQNNMLNLEKQLNGGFGASIAASGPNPDGSFVETNINYSLDPLGAPGGTIFFPEAGFPGINLDPFSPGYNPTNIVLEVIGFLDLPAGTTALVVGSDDSFRLTLGTGDNPRTYSATQPANALQNTGRGYATNRIELNVESAGVYPVRIVYGQGAGGAGFEFFSMQDYFGFPVPMLINDPTYPAESLKSYRPASLPIAPARAYVRFLNPLPGDNNSQALPTITAEMQDAGTTVVQSSVRLLLDGAVLSANVIQAGGVTTASYTPAQLLSSGAHAAQVIFQDSASAWTTNTWTFTVPAFRFVAIPAGWAYPVGSQNAAEPGFQGLVKVLRTGASFSSTVANGDANLAGTLMDPQTGAPFVNLAATTTNDYFGTPLQPGINWFGYMLANPGGTFVESNVVNYATDASGVVPAANFGNTYAGYLDTVYPGMPGADDTNYLNYANTTSFAVELRGFLHLPQGLQVIGVHADDAFQLAFQANDARDILRVSFTQNDANQGANNFPVVLDVEQEGLYSFRLIHQNYQNSANSGLELWTAPFTNQTQRTLVNATGGVKVYRSLTVPTRPYVKSISPAFGQTGVEETAPISATFANLGATVPTMKVNGQGVSYTLSTNGGDVTLTHTPLQPFRRAELVTVDLAYGGAASSWSFVTKAIYKALYVGGTKGDAINATRLASVHKMDVTVVLDRDAADPAQGTNLANGMNLILFSSSALAGSNPVNNRGFHLLPIPIINWEQAYRDDLRMEDGGHTGGGINNQSSVRIVAEGHPLAAGLPNGDHVVATAPYTFQHVSPPPAEAILIATEIGAQGRALIWALTNGATCQAGGTPFTHPAKRAFIGWAGDSGAEFFNDTGRALFDAVIRWMLPPQLSISASGGEVTVSWSGDGTLEESGTLAAGSWTTSANQANPQTRPATGMKFFRVRQ